MSETWCKYYFNTNLDSWRQVGSDSFADNVIVRPDAAVVYTRVGASDLKLTLMGEVPSRERRFVLRSSATTPVSSYWPKAVTLGTSGLENIPGWVKSTDTNVADVAMMMVSGAWRKYYHNNTRWQQLGSDSDATNIEIPVGAGVILTRKSGSGIALPAQNVPYNLN